MYGFTKSRNTRNQECFTNPYFMKGKKFMLAQVVKKNNKHIEKPARYIRPRLESQAIREDDSVRDIIDDNVSEAQMMKPYDILSMGGATNPNMSMVPARQNDVSEKCITLTAA
jgi:hypothetical protein